MSRPSAPSQAAVVLLVIGGALFVVARTTGSGWLVVLLCGLVSLVVVAAILPPLALARLAVTLSGPHDATAGQPLDLRCAVTGRGGGVRLGLVELDGPEVSVDAPATGSLRVVARRRGVVSQVAVELRSAAPLGLVPWRRRLVVTLPTPVEVGPRPLDHRVTVPPGVGAGGGRGLALGLEADELRGTRAYVAGDPMRLVHWPATARSGELLVRELDAPVRPLLAVVVDLRGPSEPAEVAAGRAAGLVIAALGEGVPVTLLTAERAGPVVARVTSAVDAGRRLARAVDAPPPEGPVPPGCHVVRVGVR